MRVSCLETPANTKSQGTERAEPLSYSGTYMKDEQTPIKSCVIISPRIAVVLEAAVLTFCSVVV